MTTKDLQVRFRQRLQAILQAIQVAFKIERGRKDAVRSARGKPTKVIILGLPNSGKSQVFNDLTGEYTLVANYPLTTVEIKRHIGPIRNREYEIIDTPGLHCLYIHSEEEIVVRDLLYAERPDGIIQCIDANRLKQSLLLTLDLIELGVPLVVSLNAIDETQQRGLAIDVRKLSELLGLEVVEVVATLNKGTQRMRHALRRMKSAAWVPDYGVDLERRLAEVQARLTAKVPYPRKTAVLLLDGDVHLGQQLRGLTGTEELAELQTAVERIRRRYRGNMGRELSRKRAVIVDSIAGQAMRQERPDIGRATYVIARLCRHPIWGLPILGLFLLLTYLLIVHVAGYIEQTLSTLVVDPIVRLIGAGVSSQFWSELLVGHYGILTLGLFNAFVTVLPILSVFFLMMGLLEDIGYLPNLSVLARRLLSRIGLSGRSVMSLVLGFGCKTMATLTTKGLTSRKEKLIAVYLIAFAIPCSAQFAIGMGILGKVGVVAFLIGYGTLAVVEVGAGFVLNRIIKEEERSDFIQELPPIRLPSIRAILKKTYHRLVWFLREAVPIFAVAAVALFLIDKSGLLDLLKALLRPIVRGWLGLPVSIVDVLILSFARHEAAAGFLLRMVDAGALTYVQSIVAVVITTMFVPCFANIVAMCREAGLKSGLLMAVSINVSAFVLAGVLNWILQFLQVGVN